MTAAGAVGPRALWSLSPACVHFWQADLGADSEFLARFLGTLEPQERARAARFHDERHRTRFLAFHGLLRGILAGYLGVPADALRFGQGPRGKPFLEAHPWLQFNLSHAGDRMLLGLACRSAIGVDIEQVPEARVVDSVADLVFSEPERSALARLTGVERRRCFTRLWTRKEAVIKADGRGVWLPLREIDVWSRDGRARLWHPAGNGWVETPRWNLCAVPAADGYAAALAVEGPVTSLVGYTCVDLS